jgi:hypothetical protein
MADDVRRPEFQFGYAACSNCGYSIFFDAAVTELWFEHLEGFEHSEEAGSSNPHLLPPEQKPTRITRKDAEEAVVHGATIDFEGREARVLYLNEKASIGMPFSALLGLDLGDGRIELSGYFSDGEFIETGRKNLD